MEISTSPATSFFKGLFSSLFSFLKEEHKPIKQHDVFELMDLANKIGWKFYPSPNSVGYYNIVSATGGYIAHETTFEDAHDIIVHNANK